MSWCGLGAVLTLTGAALGACGQHAAKGQVVAVVNGQDVTSQDLATEERSLGRRGDPQALTQRVVARVLLAQSAHARKLDSYPADPSAVARLPPTFLAQKLLQSVVKPASKPSPADVERFIASHPYAFARRMKVKLDEIRFQSGDDLKMLNGADTLTAIESRLRSLNVQMDRQSRVVDTAQLPAPLADKLASTPENQVFFVHEGDAAVGISIVSRDPVTLPAEAQSAMAVQAMNELATQRQVEAEVARLRGQAKISYQPGYAPPTPGKPGAAAPKPTAG